MIGKYWREVIGFAWKSTVKNLHLNSFIGFFGWGTGTLAVLAGLFFWSSADASRDEFLTRVFLGLAMVGLIPIVFAWHFVREPPLKHADIRGWCKELEDVILESEKTDEAIFAINDRYIQGLRLVAEGVSDELLLEWEEEFDDYIKSNFDAAGYLQLCSAEATRANYTVVYKGNVPGIITRNEPPDFGVCERIEGKLQRMQKWMSLMGGHFRGRTWNSVQVMAGTIRRVGLREHRLPPDNS